VGQKGNEVLVIDVNEVIKDLNTAYADEWLSHYQNFLHAQVIEGINAEIPKKTIIH
jgi:bacterioferritin